MSLYGKEVRLTPCLHKICDNCSEGTDTCFCGEPFTQGQLMDIEPICSSVKNVIVTEEIADRVLELSQSMVLADTHIEMLKKALEEVKSFHKEKLCYNINSLKQDIAYSGAELDDEANNVLNNIKKMEKAYQIHIDEVEAKIVQFSTSKLYIAQCMLNRAFGNCDEIINSIKNYSYNPKLITTWYQIVLNFETKWRIIGFYDAVSNKYDHYSKLYYGVSLENITKVMMLIISNENIDHYFGFKPNTRLEFISMNVRHVDVNSIKIYITNDEIRIMHRTRNPHPYHHHNPVEYEYDIIIISKPGNVRTDIFKINGMIQHIFFRQIKFVDAIATVPSEHVLKHVKLI